MGARKVKRKPRKPLPMLTVEFLDGRLEVAKYRFSSDDDTPRTPEGYLGHILDCWDTINMLNVVNYPRGMERTLRDEARSNFWQAVMLANHRVRGVDAFDHTDDQKRLHVLGLLENWAANTESASVDWPDGDGLTACWSMDGADYTAKADTPEELLEELKRLGFGGLSFERMTI